MANHKLKLSAGEGQNLNNMLLAYTAIIGNQRNQGHQLAKHVLAEFALKLQRKLLGCNGKFSLSISPAFRAAIIYVWCNLPIPSHASDYQRFLMRSIIEDLRA